MRASIIVGTGPQSAGVGQVAGWRSTGVAPRSMVAGVTLRM